MLKVIWCKNSSNVSYTYWFHLQTFNSTGRVMTLAEITDLGMKNMMNSHKDTNQRCIYENDDILIEYAITEFPRGDNNAVTLLKKTTGISKLVLWDSQQPIGLIRPDQPSTHS